MLSSRCQGNGGRNVAQLEARWYRHRVLSVLRPIATAPILLANVSHAYSDGRTYSALTFGAAAAAAAMPVSRVGIVPHAKAIFSQTMLPLSLLLTLSSGSHFTSAAIVRTLFSFRYG